MKPVNEWKLTPREIECLELAADPTCGIKKLIADRLGITLSTVEHHTLQARRKSGARSLTPVVVAWDRWRSGRVTPLDWPKIEE